MVSLRRGLAEGGGVRTWWPSSLKVLSFSSVRRWVPSGVRSRKSILTCGVVRRARLGGVGCVTREEAEVEDGGIAVLSRVYSILWIIFVLFEKPKEAALFGSVGSGACDKFTVFGAPEGSRQRSAGSFGLRHTIVPGRSSPLAPVTSGMELTGLGTRPLTPPEDAYVSGHRCQSSRVRVHVLTTDCCKKIPSQKSTNSRSRSRS